MEKITIKVTESLLSKMQARIEKTGCRSLSQCARELIELGLKIEEAASLESQENDPFDTDALLEIFKINLLPWILETRVLVRFLVEKKAEETPAEMIDLLKTAKEKSLEHVEEIFNKKHNKTVGPY